MAKGKVTASDVHELDIEDLLGRDPVSPDPLLLKGNIFQQTILVTGAGGSIGSELCRQIITQGPSNLVLVDQSEYALYSIEQELQKLVSKESMSGQTVTTIIPILASVSNADVMRNILKEYAPEITA